MKPSHLLEINEIGSRRINSSEFLLDFFSIFVSLHACLAGPASMIVEESYVVTEEIKKKNKKKKKTKTKTKKQRTLPAIVD